MANQTRRDILKMSIAFTAIGLTIALVPAKYLLLWDRRSGFAAYQKILKSTGSKDKALKSAKEFYTLFGSAFALIGSSLGLGLFLTANSLESQSEE